MENLLTPDKGLIIWTIVTFAVLVLLLGKVAWKPLIQALTDREESIRKAIADASSARQTADHMQIRLEQELAKAQDKAADLLSQAKAESQKLRDQMMKEAEADAQRLTEQTKRQLLEEKEKLSRDLRQEVAGLSVQIAEKLLRHSMNSQEQESLVQGFIQDLDKESATP